MVAFDTPQLGDSPLQNVCIHANRILYVRIRARFKKGRAPCCIFPIHCKDERALPLGALLLLPVLWQTLGEFVHELGYNVEILRGMEDRFAPLSWLVWDASPVLTPAAPAVAPAVALSLGTAIAPPAADAPATAPARAPARAPATAPATAPAMAPATAPATAPARTTQSCQCIADV